ncbi:MAG: UDP-N-acetylglucosamine 2-epimerase (non-hydrolyzing) [Bacteroidales bacterium]
MSRRILTVIGARPQFIKASVVSMALKKAGMQEVLVHTGQHFDANMSDIFFRQMGIPSPAYNLEIHSLSHGAMTGRMMEKLEEVMLKENPAMVVVYGDTNSTLAGALAAKKLQIPLAHVEAGLRSFNLAMPEEINRILTDRISDLLFCPTDTAVNNLALEGFENFPAQVIRTGDVMLDAALHFSSVAEKKTTILSELGLSGKPFVLATVHRQENTDDPERLRNIVSALNTIHREVPVVLPLHPRTRKILANMNLSCEARIIDPVGYLEMISLMNHASLVITDSGGVQKEAFFFQKKCITLRDETEWTELVEHGFNFLTGADENTILQTWKKIRELSPDFSIPLYGDGRASFEIAGYISEYVSA